tara:strand:- start:1867 stop:2148 length:282 start_codon:yes stop_codon:yes gene_type:complete
MGKKKKMIMKGYKKYANHPAMRARQKPEEIEAIEELKAPLPPPKPAPPPVVKKEAPKPVPTPVVKKEAPKPVTPPVIAKPAMKKARPWLKNKK